MLTSKLVLHPWICEQLSMTMQVTKVLKGSKRILVSLGSHNGFCLGLGDKHAEMERQSIFRDTSYGIQHASSINFNSLMGDTFDKTEPRLISSKHRSDIRWEGIQTKTYGTIPQYHTIRSPP